MGRGEEGIFVWDDGGGEGGVGSCGVPAEGLILNFLHYCVISSQCKSCGTHELLTWSLFLLTICQPSF